MAGASTSSSQPGYKIGLGYEEHRAGIGPFFMLYLSIIGLAAVANMQLTTRIFSVSCCPFLC